MINESHDESAWMSSFSEKKEIEDLVELPSKVRKSAISDRCTNDYD
jgi:hypothetical protein